MTDSLTDNTDSSTHVDVPFGNECDERPTGARPERTCAACGTKGHKSAFLRFVMSPDAKLTLDIRHKLQSRGVYVCSEKACITKALKKKVFSRFLKTEGAEPQFTLLLDGVISAYEAYLLSLMSMGLKSRRLVLGSGAVFGAAEKRHIFLVLVAKDAGGSIRSKAEYLARQKCCAFADIMDKAGTANKLGIDETAIMAVTDEHLARTLAKGWRIYDDAILWREENKEKTK